MVTTLKPVSTLPTQDEILRQLRSGFPRRPQGFPHSVG
ncbi:hypothetical protein CRD_00611, partial [Raphidiopsis brookii D9]